MSDNRPTFGNGVMRRFGFQSVSDLRQLRPGEFRKNKDGSVSTEISITENLGGDSPWSNIPTLWMSGDEIIELDAGRAVDAAIEYEKRTGHKFPRFMSVDTAVEAAKKRSQAGGVFNGDLWSAPR